MRKAHILLASLLLAMVTGCSENRVADSEPPTGDNPATATEAHAATEQVGTPVAGDGTSNSMTHLKNSATQSAIAGQKRPGKATAKQ